MWSLALHASCSTAERRRPPRAATALLALLCALGLAAALGASPASAADAAAPQASAAAARFGPAVLAELNRIRAARGLPGVVADGRMARTASAHSRDMARRGYFAHGRWSPRVARAAGRPHAVGEVIGWLSRAQPSREARGIVQGWLRSAPHRHVLLDPGFRRVGIGRATGRLSGYSAAIYTVDWATAR